MAIYKTKIVWTVKNCGSIKCKLYLGLFSVKILLQSSLTVAATGARGCYSSDLKVHIVNRDLNILFLCLFLFFPYYFWSCFLEMCGTEFIVACKFHTFLNCMNTTYTKRFKRVLAEAHKKEQFSVIGWFEVIKEVS